MHKIAKTCAAVLLLSLVIAAPALADYPDRNSTSSEHATPVLTEMQKQELAALYKNMFDQKKQLIAKYLQFGVITDEKAKLWTERVDQHYAKLEQKGFVPQRSHCRKFRENKRD